MNVDMKSPAFRNLRGYAFDPSLSLKIDTVTINEIVYRVPWEDLAGEECDPGDPGKAGPGPVGKYVEVVDYDPTVGRHYAPVDLNRSYALAVDGLDPSGVDPHFHPQLV